MAAACETVATFGKKDNLVKISSMCLDVNMICIFPHNKMKHIRNVSYEMPITLRIGVPFVLLIVANGSGLFQNIMELESLLLIHNRPTLDPCRSK